VPYLDFYAPALGTDLDIYASGSMINSIGSNGEIHSTPTPRNCMPWTYPYCVNSKNYYGAPHIGLFPFRAAGTSFSSPMVAGNVALMKQINPGLNVASARAIIRQNADLNSPNSGVNYDGGILNVYRTLYSMGAR
jgi:hypothetical protein